MNDNECGIYDKEWYKVKEHYDKYLKRRGIKRVGKCSQCGECCKNIMTFKLNYRTHTYISGKRNYNKNCNLLDSNNKCTCNGSKPLLCKLWPFKPSDLKWFPECTYRFIKNETKD